MTQAQAETLATLLVGVAATGATYYILRTPALRRAAWQLVKGGLAAAGPWLVGEARSAWAASGQRRDDTAANAGPAPPASSG